MPVGGYIRFGARYRVLDRGSRSPNGNVQFCGLFNPLKSIRILCYGALRVTEAINMLAELFVEKLSQVLKVRCRFCEPTNSIIIAMKQRWHHAGKITLWSHLFLCPSPDSWRPLPLCGLWRQYHEQWFIYLLHQKIATKCKHKTT